MRNSYLKHRLSLFLTIPCLGILIGALIAILYFINDFYYPISNVALVALALWVSLVICGLVIIKLYYNINSVPLQLIISCIISMMVTPTLNIYGLLRGYAFKDTDFFFMYWTSLIVALIIAVLCTFTVRVLLHRENDGTSEVLDYLN